MDGEKLYERETEVRLTVLTFLILVLIGLLVVYTGYYAVSAERIFFRNIVLSSNQEISVLIARQLIQVFSNSTGVADDLAHFPGVVGRDLKTMEYLFDVALRRHPTLRVLYFYDTQGQRLLIRYRATITDPREFREIDAADVRRILGTGNVLVTDPYTVGMSPALTYGVRVSDKRGTVAGVLVAEIDLEFIRDIVASVRIGRTGQILIVTPMRTVVFASPGVLQSDVAELELFPLTEAFAREKGGLEYGATTPRLASYAKVRAIVFEQFRRLPGMRGPLSPDDLTTSASLFSVPLTTTKVPDWMVVIQQQAAEGYMLADRMKYNIVILVAVALVGLGLVAKLWIDSLA